MPRSCPLFRVEFERLASVARALGERLLLPHFTAMVISGWFNGSVKDYRSDTLLPFLLGRFEMIGVADVGFDRAVAWLCPLGFWTIC